MLTAAQVISRRNLFPCCSLDWLSKSIDAEIHGDPKCAKDAWAKMIYMYWAADVMNHTPVGDETEEVGCYTIAFATQVANKADCWCETCNCSPAQPPFDSECDIVAQYQVIDAVDQDNLPLSPSVDDAYYILEGANVGEIATWDGADWVYTTIPLNSVVETQSGDFYTNTGNGPGLLFPPIDATLVSAVNNYEVVSVSPTVAQGSTRTIVLQGYVNNAWTTFYTGVESDIATPTVFQFGTLPITGLRIIYVVGNCSYVAPGVVEPPFGGCGTVDIDMEPVVVCDANEFSISVDIISADLWPIGDIVATVDGVEQPGVQGVLGPQTIGPFPSYSTVGVVVSNLNDSECNFDGGEFNDTTLPIVDAIVESAVDASFQSSALPDTRYLIVSDTEDSGNLWAANVGRIVENTTFTTPAANDIIFTTDTPGAQGYWQLVSAGVVVPVFPPIILEFNGTTLQWFYYVNTPLAPEIVGTTVSATYDCGSPSSLYDGLIDGLTEPQFFIPGCGIEVISGDITYSYGGCEYTIPAIVQDYSPGGEPDPEFSAGGLNNLVADVRITNTGQILVGGQFTAYGVTTANRFTRLNADGTLDVTFNTALGTGANNHVLGVEYDDAGNALVCGFFTQFNGNAAGHIIRILPNGLPDPAFVTGTGFNSTYAQDMAIDPVDGTIIVGGIFTQYDGNTHNRLVALNPDGSVNTSWNFGTGLGNQYAQEVIIGDDGNLYVCGPFTSYNGTNLGAGPHLIRILPDGTLDTSFDAYNKQFSDDIQDIAYLPDGRIMAVGEFTTFDGSPAPCILMLQNDGTVDTAFMTGVGVGYGQTWQDIRPLPNGQIMISGAAPSQIGNPLNNIIRLNADGTRDNTFSLGTGINGSVFDIALDTNGTLVAGGAFTIHDGVGRLRVTRII